MGQLITQKLNKRSPISNIHMKYVDDLSMAQSLNLIECLIPNPDPKPARPLSYHDRTGHLLPTDTCHVEGTDQPTSTVQ